MKIHTDKQLDDRTADPENGKPSILQRAEKRKRAAIRKVAPYAAKIADPPAGWALFMDMVQTELRAQGASAPSPARQDVGSALPSHGYEPNGPE